MINWDEVDKTQLSYKLMDLIKIYDVGIPKIRIGHPFDGGYILLEDLCKGIEVVYSFGVDIDVSFDADFSNKYNPTWIRLYDHTINGLPVGDLHPDAEPGGRGCHVRNHVFCKKGIGGSKTEQLDLLENYIIENGDKGRRMILKMDVEGAEWESFDASSSNTLRLFEQITLELHRMHDEDLHAIQYRILEKLTHSFYIYHAHLNNSKKPQMVNGLLMPWLLEVSFVRKDLVDAVPTREVFPTELDGPNMWDQPDLPLNYWPYLRE
jgi:hypothetical protein